MKNAVESIDNHFDKIPFETDQYDRYEIEAYKGIKNDPFCKWFDLNCLILNKPPKNGKS